METATPIDAIRSLLPQGEPVGVDVYAYRGAAEHSDGATWLTTDPDHARGFGEVRLYNLYGTMVRVHADHLVPEGVEIEDDEWTGGAEAALAWWNEHHGVSALVIEDFEGRGLTFYTDGDADLVSE
ncbi:MAG: hypothetical protein AAFV53_19875 [Myxococcota bacterium]